MCGHRVSDPAAGTPPRLTCSRPPDTLTGRVRRAPRGSGSLPVGAAGGALAGNGPRVARGRPTVCEPRDPTQPLLHVHLSPQDMPRTPARLPVFPSRNGNPCFALPRARKPNPPAAMAVDGSSGPAFRAFHRPRATGKLRRSLWSHVDVGTRRGHQAPPSAVTLGTASLRTAHGPRGRPTGSSTHAARACDGRNAQCQAQHPESQEGGAPATCAPRRRT